MAEVAVTSGAQQKRRPKGRPITGGPTVWSGGLGIDFGKRVDWSVLNEDTGTDEIYVLIRFTDCALGARPVMIRTADIVHNF